MKIIKILLISIFFANSIFAADVPNSVYLGLGVSKSLNKSENEFNLLAGYNRHIDASPALSFGGFVEFAFSHHNLIILGAPIGIYPEEHLKFWIAPCFSYGGGGREFTVIDEVAYFQNKNQFMFKFGGGYDFPLPNPAYSAFPYIEGSVINSEFILSIGVKMNLHFDD